MLRRRGGSSAFRRATSKRRSPERSPGLRRTATSGRDAGDGRDGGVVRAPAAGQAGSGVVAIVTALPEELQALLCRAEGLRRTEGLRQGANAAAAWTGTLAGRPVALACTGDGAARAGRGLVSVLEGTRAAAWIGAGFAGGLSPDLAAGTILVPRKIRDSSGEIHAVASGWTERVLAGGGAVPGAIAAAERIVASAAGKARLRAELPAGEPWAVDLESLAWMQAASSGPLATAPLPGLIVRVISDSAEEELPAFLPLCAGEDGAIDRRQVAFRALRHPSAIGKLLAMRRRARFCAERLADYLEALAARSFADPA